MSYLKKDKLWFLNCRIVKKDDQLDLLCSLVGDFVEIENIHDNVVGSVQRPMSGGDGPW